MPDLWRSDTYISPDIDIIINADIREYDASSAGMNVLFRANALSLNEVTYLKTLPKLERNIKLGLMLRDDKELARIQKEGLQLMRKDFMEANNIQDEEIISIKKDAFFLHNKTCQVTDIDNIHFKLANRFTSFAKLGRTELYFRRSLMEGNILDVKGIDDSMLKLHESGMLDFLMKVFIKAETSTNERIIKFLYKFALDYKNGNLPIEYYREFNNQSMYRLMYNFAGNSVGLNAVDSLDGVNTSFNYTNVILKMISYF